MKQLCKSLIILAAAISIALTPLVAVTAATCTAQEQSKNVFSCACGETSTTKEAIACKSTGEDPITGPYGVLAKAEGIIAIFSGVAAVIIIIVSGLKFVTANGDAQKVANARSTLLYALIGIAIIVLANAIVAFIVKGL